VVATAQPWAGINESFQLKLSKSINNRRGIIESKVMEIAWDVYRISTFNSVRHSVKNLPMYASD
jgi:hypothetical protein